jgi:hypothetical protein
MSEIITRAMGRKAETMAARLPQTSAARQHLIEAAASPGRPVDDEDWRRLV